MLLVANSRAGILPNSLFADHAVLQRDKPLPVWGTGSEGQAVIVRLANQTASTTVKDGKWMVKLAPLEAGGPHTLSIEGGNRFTFEDVLIGDVWVCSGQSNMERNLGPRRGQQEIDNWREEVAKADYPTIRQFSIAPKQSLVPAADANGTWQVCSPASAADFSAVGYFFARDLQTRIKVPIGILFSALGGTVAEAWTSAAGLAEMADFKAAVLQQNQFASEYPATNPEDALEQWFAKNDPGSEARSPWSKAVDEAAETAWKPVQLPGAWGKSVLPDFNGVVWFSRVVNLPESWTGRAVIPILKLGRIREADKAWINGVPCGVTVTSLNRAYRVPPNTLIAGPNRVTVRVLCRNRAFEAGFLGKPAEMELTNATDPQMSPMPLAGEWSYRPGASTDQSPPCPGIWRLDKNMPSGLYNAMIAPLMPAPITGVAWYQGEQNVARAAQYRELFPRLIRDWRTAWNLGNFPFLFVQIAPYQTMIPELREAQLLALKQAPNSAMVVTVDCGDGKDIHPTRKQPVGARLALAARKLAYGHEIEHSGPLFAKAEFQNAQAIISFSHSLGGLVARGGPLRGFTIAGADKSFVPAAARIVGNRVIVEAEAVKQPVAVRYGWENVPDVNLFNAEGLPASPFRSDIEGALFKWGPTP